ncbi:caspase family protein [Sphingomonas sp. LY54]|uniref:caspase family protein n=1 Tax=Sphingomonas sp. LY54 TaxID=3095343 RepID=UPI002D776371|nr:caspase family protein [Sphingomonas sp. LY54]WRP29304.1 caspase family protein [Sphingomonas sp. LY54]
MAKGYSLHLGLNSVDPAHYDAWSGQLRACEFDANDMHAIAKSLGYQESQVLLTKQATSQALLGALLDYSKKLVAGDILLLTYAGHGGQVDDDTGDEEDKLDETWLLYDRMVIDDELYRMYGLFKPGVRISIISDSCHSGSVNKLREQEGTTEDIGEFVSRLADIDLTRSVFEKHASTYLPLQIASAGASAAPIPAGVILLSGCKDTQVSLDGTKNGLFTEKLKKVWKNGAFKGGYGKFHQQIAAQMPMSQSPQVSKVGTVDAAFVNQKPFAVA